MDETKLILGASKELDESIINERSKDLNNIMKYLLPQTFHQESDNWNNLQKICFLNFIHQVGMFLEIKPIKTYCQLLSAELHVLQEGYLKSSRLLEVDFFRKKT